MLRNGTWLLFELSFVGPGSAASRGRSGDISSGAEDRGACDNPAIIRLNRLRKGIWSRLESCTVAPRLRSLSRDSATNTIDISDMMTRQTQRWGRLVGTLALTFALAVAGGFRWLAPRSSCVRTMTFRKQSTGRGPATRCCSSPERPIQGTSSCRTRVALGRS